MQLVAALEHAGQVVGGDGEVPLVESAVVELQAGASAEHVRQVGQVGAHLPVAQIEALKSSAGVEHAARAHAVGHIPLVEAAQLDRVPHLHKHGDHAAHVAHVPLRKGEVDVLGFAEHGGRLHQALGAPAREVAALQVALAKGVAHVGDGEGLPVVDVAVGVQVALVRPTLEFAQQRMEFPALDHVRQEGHDVVLEVRYLHAGAVETQARGAVAESPGEAKGRQLGRLRASEHRAQFVQEGAILEVRVLRDVVFRHQRRQQSTSLVEPSQLRPDRLQCLRGNSLGRTHLPLNAAACGHNDTR